MDRSPLGVLGGSLVAAVLFATLCAALARWSWVADLAVHFPAQYAVMALIGGAALLGARYTRWAVLALLLTVFNAAIAFHTVASASGGNPGGPVAAHGEGVPLRVATVNVLYGNRKHREVIDFLRSARPDVVVLVEVTPRWRSALAELEPDYPHRFATQGRRSNGILLLSRRPLLDPQVLALEGIEEPAAAATLRVQGRAVRIVGVHASWPIGPGSYARRNRQLAELSTLARSRAAPMVVLGDLNVSPFSPHFQRFVAAAGLRSAANGFGWQPTWPSPLTAIGIQIDHVLVSPEIHVLNFGRGPAVGSDHLPVVADLVL